MAEKRRRRRRTTRARTGSEEITGARVESGAIAASFRDGTSVLRERANE